MSEVDTDAIRRLMERLRSEDEHETEQAIGHLLDQADAGVFERAADEIDRLRVRVAELEAAARECLDEVRGTMAYCPATDALAALVAKEGEQG